MGGVAGARPRRYPSFMTPHVNFADPLYEPSDEELAGLMHEAFDGIALRRETSLQEMRARIAALAEATLQEFEARGQRLEPR